MILSATLKVVLKFDASWQTWKIILTSIQTQRFSQHFNTNFLIVPAIMSSDINQCEKLNTWETKVVVLSQFKHRSLSWRVDSCTSLESEPAAVLITSSHKASKVLVEEIVGVSRCNIIDTKLSEGKKLPAKCFEIIYLSKRCFGLTKWAISPVRQEKMPMRHTPSAYAMLHHAPYSMRMRRTPCACAVLHAHAPYSMRMRHTPCACAILKCVIFVIIEDFTTRKLLWLEILKNREILN